MATYTERNKRVTTLLPVYDGEAVVSLVETWQVEVVDSTGNVIATRGGSGSTIWDGLSATQKTTVKKAIEAANAGL